MSNISLSKYIIGFEENTLSTPLTSIASHSILPPEVEAAVTREIVMDLHDYIERDIDVVDGGIV